MTIKLSVQLYDRCRTSFLKCSQFESHSALRAVFAAGELAFYRNGVPEMGNKNDRVDSLIDYLLDQSFCDGRPVIAIFVESLLNKYQPNQALFVELFSLRQDIDQEFAGIVDIPFVVVAMTIEEAQDLFSESVFNNSGTTPDERSRFKNFKQELLNHVHSNCVDRYGSDRDSWCPLMEQQKTINQIVWDIVADVNEQRQASISSPQIFRPKFVSADFFSNNVAVHQKNWDDLSRSGCVLIVDAISLFHPQITEKLRQSHVSSGDNIAMLIVSPININDIPVNKIIEQEFSTRLERAFMRFNTHLDMLCEFGIGDTRSLRRWIFSTLPTTANIIQKQKSNRVNKELIRQLMGEPQGIDRLIFGRGDPK